MESLLQNSREHDECAANDMQSLRGMIFLDLLRTPFCFTEEASIAITSMAFDRRGGNIFWCRAANSTASGLIGSFGCIAVYSEVLSGFSC